MNSNRYNLSIGELPIQVSSILIQNYVGNKAKKTKVAIKSIKYILDPHDGWI